jgi:hypothetical protein
MSNDLPFADVALARRLEHTEGTTSSRIVDMRARLDPARQSCWIAAAGGQAMFDGASSPMTQTFGLGLFDPVTDAVLDTVERFFQERGAPVHHEVSPLADASCVALLNARGYQPFEFTSVMYRYIHPPPDGRMSDAIRVRSVGVDEAELWGRTAAAGWDMPDAAAFMIDLGRASVDIDGARLYVAELDGRPIATATLHICDGVAFLAGASTIPEGRRHGAQFALLDRRLRDGADAGCDIALMGALPGSASQRNAERHGFRIAYTRIKWRLP